MRQLDQQEMNYVGGGHSHESDGMFTTAVKTVTMAGTGILAGFLTHRYYPVCRTGVTPKATAYVGILAASLASSLTCLAIGMGKEYIYPAGGNKNQ